MLNRYHWGPDISKDCARSDSLKRRQETILHLDSRKFYAMMPHAMHYFHYMISLKR